MAGQVARDGLDLDGQAPAEDGQLDVARDGGDGVAGRRREGPGQLRVAADRLDRDTIEAGRPGPHVAGDGMNLEGDGLGRDHVHVAR